MSAAIYTLCTLTALMCAGLLLRGFAVSRSRLLLWSGLCFVGLSVTNALLVVEKVAFASLDLATWRLAIALLSLSLLLFALIYEEE
jgi:hypothetical protein